MYELDGCWRNATWMDSKRIDARCPQIVDATCCPYVKLRLKLGTMNQEKNKQVLLLLCSGKQRRRCCTVYVFPSVLLEMRGALQAVQYEEIDVV